MIHSNVSTHQLKLMQTANQHKWVSNGCVLYAQLISTRKHSLFSLQMNDSHTKTILPLTRSKP